MNDRQNKLKFFRVILSECKKMFKYKPSISVLCMFIGVNISILLYLQTIILEKLFNNISLEKVISLNIYVCFGVLCLTIIISDILNGIYNYMVDKQSIIITMQIEKQLFHKLNKFNVLKLENPEFLNKVNKASVGVGNSSKLFIKVQSLISNSVIYLILISVYLYKLTPILLTVILLSFVPTVISYVFRNKIKYVTEEKLVVERRKMAEYELYISDKKYFKETRYLGAVNFFKNKFIKSCIKFNELNLRSFTKINNIKLILNTIKFIGFISILAVIYYLAINGIITIGAVGAVLATVTIIYNKIGDLFNSELSNISELYNGMYNLHTFLQIQLDEKKKELEDKEIHIKLKDLSFKYPNSTKNVLEHINLDIEQNEIIAIVGENGSGKTTLAKLIAGLYLPTEGDIEYNDISISQINLKTLYEKITIAFQDYKQYVLSIKENIAISDIKNIDEQKIAECIEDVGLDDKVNSLEEKNETLLSKEFGGVDLSIGQWQRIAIARAKYKEFSVIIFDEPTASLDPILEIDLINKFMKFSKGKIIIIVTHRIGAAKLANKIVTMKNGKIVEVGNHNELVAFEGEYKRLYESQKQWYV